MQKATAYQEVADFKGLTINKLESTIGASNGSIRKAIERNSTVTAAIAEKIVHAFPDINRNWLLAGEGEMVGTSALTKKPGTNAPGGDYQPTMLDLLKIKDELIAAEREAKEAEREAKEAYKRISQLQDSFYPSLEKLQTEVNTGFREQQIVRLFVLGRLAGLEGVAPSVLDAALDKQLMAVPTPHRKRSHSKSDQGK